MSRAKPLVVFVFTKEGKPRSTRYDGFAARLKRHGGLKGVDTLTCALENLLYQVNEDGSARVIDTVSGVELNRASLVYLKSWESMPEEASALTIYLDSLGVPYVDGLSKEVGVSKLAEMFRMWSSDIMVPQTFYIKNNDKLIKFLGSSKDVSWPLIMKDVSGEKGKINFLVQSIDHASEILSEFPETAFICQRFVPNKGDYRVGVYMGKASFAILRKGDGSTHLNNTSAGGTAEYVPISKLPAGMARFAEKAAVAANLKIAGVDVMVDSNTEKPMILEVNQGSQIVTGVFVDENIQAFNEALESAIKKRYTRPATKPLIQIGRRAYVSLPELGVGSALAKIDTGAYSSTIHAENIEITTNDAGEDVLSFSIAANDKLELNNDQQQQRISTTDFFTQVIKSSNGHEEERCSIRTKLKIEGKTFVAIFTLTDRGSMSCPVLIGRRILRSRFFVNVELSEFNRAEWKY